MEQESCETCKFIIIDPRVNSAIGICGCRRYPKIISKKIESWCGEYKFKDPRIDFAIAESNKSKWAWMMDYCEKKGISPAQEFAWDKAEKAYNKQIFFNSTSNNTNALI